MGIWKIRKSRCDDNALNSKFLKNQLWPTEKKGKNKKVLCYFFYFQYMETLETKSSIKVATILYASNICYWLSCQQYKYSKDIVAS